MEPDDLVSAEQLGAWLQLNERQVRKLAERQIIERDGRGRYRLQKSVQAVVIHQREVSAGRKADAAVDSAPLDLVAERARVAKEMADGLSMKNAQRRGELVEVAIACREMERDYSRVRTRLLALPSSHAAQLARLRTPHEVNEALTKLIIEVLEELSAGKGWDERGGQDDTTHDVPPEGDVE